jgi:hypothetical protein
MPVLLVDRAAPSKRLHVLPVLLAALVLFPGIVRADVQTVTGVGEYRMGDRDTREDAVRLAVEAAKRDALEQVAIYVEHVAVSVDDTLTRDEVRTYTAGIVIVSEQTITTRLDGDVVVIRAELTGQIDPEEAGRAVLTLRGHEQAREQLTLLRTEVDDLHRRLAEANAQIASAPTSDDLQAATAQRQNLLNRVESDGLVAQAWTDVALSTPTMAPSAWIGPSQAPGLLTQAYALYPANPHIVVLQQRLPAPLVVVPRLPSHLPRLGSLPPQGSAPTGWPRSHIGQPFHLPPQFGSHREHGGFRYGGNHRGSRR